MRKLGFEVVNLEQVRTLLADAGAAGWELVTVDEQAWVFKRPLK